MTTTTSTTVLLVLALLASCSPRSLPGGGDGLENSLERLLGSYYDSLVANEGGGGGGRRPAGGEEMQGDQPIVENNVQEAANATTYGGAANGSSAEAEYIRAMKDRAKENWIQILKENILRQMGRENTTTSKKSGETRTTSSSFSSSAGGIPSFLNATNTIDDDQITEKIRGFYPSCDVPSNTDQDLWKNDDVMNLYFDYDYVPEDRNANIATATLRLYRLPENGTKLDVRPVDCDVPPFGDEDRLLRVSVYWYTKSLKKRRVKHRRLSDSRVISDATKWVELSVKPATKAWSRGKNLGLAVVLEDQEGNPLRADRYFKGASCMVGTSTPKPIPTVIIDAAQRSNELEQISNLLGRNTTSALHSDVHLLPTIDVCTLEFPDNYTQPEHVVGLRVNACNLRKMHEQSQRLAEIEKLERLRTLPELLAQPAPPRHIRHQRGHPRQPQQLQQQDGFDPRSRIEGATVLIRRDELKNFTRSVLGRSTTTTTMGDR